ncbi:MAG TPA: pyridoxamine kinase [Methanocorpusculum sp.]|nr:pyridoxamine kinase [Methanocorpusculum sp.]
MEYKRILTIQDISCFGQCSLTVALPILSACGLETVILPSAVLSTHTSGFTGFTCRDLTDDFPAIINHWKAEKISFGAVYTGYLGSPRQVEHVKTIFEDMVDAGGLRIVDPAMADNGMLYPAFDDVYVNAMKDLISVSDIIVPNITEACFLTGIEYKETYDEAYIDRLVAALQKSGAKTIVLTGVSYKKGMTGVLVVENGKKQYYSHIKYSMDCHGTGDVYASSFVGALMNGKTTFEAAIIAADFTVRCIKETIFDEKHWYGVIFEPVLGELIKTVRG